MGIPYKHTSALWPRSRQRLNVKGFERTRCQAIGNAFSVLVVSYVIGHLLADVGEIGGAFEPDAIGEMLQAPYFLVNFKPAKSMVDPARLTQRLYERASHRLTELRCGISRMSGPCCWPIKPIPSKLFDWRVLLHTLPAESTSTSWNFVLYYPLLNGELVPPHE
jgi:hypothetical protein